MANRKLRSFQNSETFAYFASEKWALPFFLSEKNKLIVGAIWTAVAAVLYLTTNHFTLFEPVTLPMLSFDEAIPFIPHTIWIYLSEYPLFVTVYLLSKDVKNANKYLYSFLFLQVFSILIFIVYPTTYPRHLFPLPQDLDAATYFIFSSLRSADTPNSCLPSLHVSSCYLSSFIFLNEQKKKFPFFFFWATAVAFTTMTTKQHYLVDVIAGFLLAVMFYWIFHRCVSYREVFKITK